MLRSVSAECVTTNSNADYPKFVKGDPGVEDIFYWPNGVSKLNKSVPQYPNSGGHFLTGYDPIEGEGEGGRDGRSGGKGISYFGI